MMAEIPPADAGHKKTLLVVDDAPANIQVVQSILKDEYKIRVATSGEKALELVKTQPRPDLILLDVMMPGLDGYQVCEQLKAAPETRDIPVIFLTGRTEIDDETKGLALGALDYIRKPFSPAIVKARVRTQLLLRDSREQVNRQVQAVNHELEMARYIQLSILPGRAPAVPGVTVAVRYLPMTTIAGDYYDYLPVDEKRLGILVADVSGHGAPSALITSMLKIVLAEQAPHASDPAKVLGGMNDALCGKFDRHFVTAAYIFLDLEKGILRYGGAGHPPLSIWRASSGKAEAIEENGLLLAQFPDETYTFVEVPFESGDRVVLNTDGVSECQNPEGEEFGTGRLLAFLNENRGLPPEGFADAAIDALFQWSKQPRGENQHDDITLLAIDFGEV
jgi:sigma-B regulation protein RsbU (phosphoserine phosphatase)